MLSHISIDSFLAKIARDIPSSISYQEDDIIEWVGEALDAIGSYEELDEKVSFLPVKNYTATLPTFSKNLIQIVKHRDITKVDSLTKCMWKITEELQTNDNMTEGLLLGCNGKMPNDYEVAYYRPFFSLKWDYGNWIGSASYQRLWIPLLPTNNSFFNLDREGIDSNKLYVDGDRGNSHYEYKIMGNRTLKFNFAEGYIAVAYTSVKIDEDGLPLIPDDISFTSACKYYILKILSEKELMTNTEGAASKISYFEDRWQHYCGQAANKSKALLTIDELESFTRQRNYIIPRMYQEHGNYFGNLGDIDNRTYLRNTIRSRINYRIQ